MNTIRRPDTATIIVEASQEGEGNREYQIACTKRIGKDEIYFVLEIYTDEYNSVSLFFTDIQLSEFISKLREVVTITQNEDFK